MKNFASSKKEKEMFILNYKIKDQDIIINLASGNIKVIPYSIENEVKILKYMKEQVINAKDFIEKQQFRKESLFIGTIFINSQLINLTIMSGLIGDNITFNYSITIMAIINTINYILWSRINKNISDYEKNSYFIQHEEMINETLKEMKEQDTIPKIRKYFDKMLATNSLNDNNFNLTLNDLDDMSLKELELFTNQKQIIR